MKRQPILSRREILAWAAAVAALPSCLPRAPKPSTTQGLPEQIPSGNAKDERFEDATDALFDVLLPTELDVNGVVTSPGARETGVDRVLETESFVKLAIAQGLIRPLDQNEVDALDDLSGAARTALNAQLDLFAQEERPDTPFRHLPRALQEKIVRRAFDDDACKPVLTVLRAACFVAYLGGSDSDRGLVALGFPPFVDSANELETNGFDDYSFDQAPQPSGEDLSLVLTPGGDLL